MNDNNDQNTEPFVSLKLYDFKEPISDLDLPSPHVLFVKSFPTGVTILLLRDGSLTIEKDAMTTFNRFGKRFDHGTLRIDKKDVLFSSARVNKDNSISLVTFERDAILTTDDGLTWYRTIVTKHESAEIKELNLNADTLPEGTTL